jgi:hypothetical protein
MSKFADRARNMQESIKKILLEHWDPIGINNIPEAKDEYDSYVPTVYKLLITTRNKTELFDYLWWVETEYIGVCGNRQKTENIVFKLFEMFARFDSPNEE